MIEKNAVKRIESFANEHGIRFGSTNPRPWGSWDLVILNPERGNILNTGQTFGYGFTLEEGFAVFLHRVIKSQVDHELKKFVIEYIGQNRMDSVSNIFNTTTESVIDSSMALVKV